MNKMSEIGTCRIFCCLYNMSLHQMNSVPVRVRENTFVHIFWHFMLSSFNRSLNQRQRPNKNNEIPHNDKVKYNRRSFCVAVCGISSSNIYLIRPLCVINSTDTRILHCVVLVLLFFWMSMCTSFSCSYIVISQ